MIRESYRGDIRRRNNSIRDARKQWSRFKRKREQRKLKGLRKAPKQDIHLGCYDERCGRHEPESIKTLMKNGNAERNIGKELLEVATLFR